MAPAGPPRPLPATSPPGTPLAGSAAWRGAVGRRGEALAATYLEDTGWRVLDRNWRPGPGARADRGGPGGREARRDVVRGELDIIALDPGGSGPPGPEDGVGRPTLVAVEVKTRTSVRHGLPAEAVGPRKLARMRSLAAAWAATHAVSHDGLRVDVVSVLLQVRAPAILRHHRGVVL